SGGHDAAALRALPIAVAALTVGVVAFWSASRWGLVAGATASALLAANPMFAVLSRSVRGYSLLTFTALASTLLLTRLLTGCSRRLLIASPALVAAGIATHLYALLVLAGHITVVVARRRVNSGWLYAWAGTLVLGLGVYAELAPRMLSAASREHAVFRGR